MNCSVCFKTRWLTQVFKGAHLWTTCCTPPNPPKISDVAPTEDIKGTDSIRKWLTMGQINPPAGDGINHRIQFDSGGWVHNSRDHRRRCACRLSGTFRKYQRSCGNFPLSGPQGALHQFHDQRRNAGYCLFA